MSDMDPFLWRNGGFRFEIGNKDDGGIVDMFAIGNQMVGVTKKSIHKITLADEIDPARTNSHIPNSKQVIFPYGADEAFVARTLLQAKVLFADHCLPTNINLDTALAISLSFLNEYAAIDELKNSYISLEEKCALGVNGALDTDGSLRIPTLHLLDEKVKQLINSVDHAMLLVKGMVLLFYPDINDTIWTKPLLAKISKQKGKTHPSLDFIKSVASWGWLFRNLRNCVEHPEDGSRIEIRNYELLQTGEIRQPVITFHDKDTPLPTMPVLDFIKNATESLLTCFEGIIAHLCNIYALPFADRPRSVVEVPPTDRDGRAMKVRFEYHIDWGSM